MRHNAVMKLFRISLLALAACAVHAQAQAPAQTRVYRCPGNVYTSSNELTPKQADEKGCKVIEAQPITILSPAPRSAPAASAASAARAPEAKVDPAEQRARDRDARRILEAELKRDEAQLATMRQEFNNGEPERQGNERNYQAYQDRVATMRAAIARKESDVAALKREIAKLPP
jgi:hypothetical protein